MPSPPPAEPALVETARAKLNLDLLLTGKRANGYHELDSLVVFAEVGDLVTLRPAPELALECRGPFAADLPPGKFEPVGLSIIGGSLVSPGAMEANEHNLPKDAPLRALFLADKPSGPPDWTYNMLLRHGVRCGKAVVRAEGVVHAEHPGPEDERPEALRLNRERAQHGAHDAERRSRGEAGAAATLGPVAEPYTVGFPKPAEFFGLLTTGQYTLVECYYRTLLLNSWMTVLIGDPLYNPYAHSPKLKAEQVQPSPAAPTGP